MRNVQSTLLYRWFDEVWNRGDEGAIDRLMSDHATANGLVDEHPPKGAGEFKVFFRDFKNQFHDIQVDVDDAVCQDDIESARTTVSAVHTASGKPVKFSGMCMVRVADGKIAEAWNNYDFSNLNKQIAQEVTP